MNSTSNGATANATTEHHAGRIPFRLRIGVTGHRNIDVSDSLVAVVDGLIEELCRAVDESSEGGVRLTVISSLANGADQLVAQRVLLHDGATLEVVLPYEQDRYRAGLEDGADEFDRLIAVAESVQTLPDPLRAEDGYQLAGRAVADRADVLIALWDGHAARGQGGTAEIVEYAQRRIDEAGNTACPVIVVDPTDPRPTALTHEHRRMLDAVSLADANVFNRGLDQRATQPLLAADAVQDEATAQLLHWIQPFYARADSLAVKEQRRYVTFGLLIVIASTVALVSAAVAAIFDVEPWATAVELVALVAMVAAVGLGKRARYHGTWISSRFLAERFRSALFLAAAGAEKRRDSATADDSPDSQNDWVRRAYAEVWRAKPAVDVSTDQARTLAVGWVAGQVGYHQRVAAMHERRQRLALGAIWILLMIAIGIAIAHLVVHFVSHEEADATARHLLSLVAIMLPALGGAITAVTAQRDHERHHKRHERIALELSRSADQLRVTKERVDLTAMVIAAEQVMVAENRDWFGSVRFHDFEPHV